MTEPIRYRLSFPQPHTHYVEVEARVPTAGRDEVELMMAVWTPGSYLVREYSRHLEEATATGERGELLRVVKTGKNRWRLEAAGAREARLCYRLYCRELTVRTNFVDAGFALLNGAPTFVTLADGLPRPHEVYLDLPRGWPRSVSALPAIDGAPHAYRARDFDHLIDSPIYAGDPTIHELAVEGTPHRLVNEGNGELWDGARSAADVAALAGAHRAFWGSFPYPAYTIINLMIGARGGLEHADSAVLMTSPWSGRTRKGYIEWLGLVSHELFHAWNGKRLRPCELGPFDYEQEVLTRGLWVVEGMTSYYDDLLVHRAGLSTREEYLERFSRLIERLQSTYGRLVQPLEDASFDAWIKLYRTDENTVNSAVSYYVKGAVVAWLLDVEIRRASDDRSSLDDVLRLAYERFSGSRGFAHGELRAAAEEVAGCSLTGFFHHTLETTAELDYRPALDWLGLRFTTAEKAEETPADERGWMGAKTEASQGALVVCGVPRCTPAHAAGLNVGDELLAVDGYRVTPDTWQSRLEAYRPGQPARLLVARRERLVELAVTFAAEPELAWRLEPAPDAEARQRLRLDAWLAAPLED